MAPIPVYTNSPITAAKPDGVTPKTAAAAEDTPSKVSSTPSSTSAYTPSAYPAPRPGAVPSLPTPTGSAATQQYSPPQPTPTTSIGSFGPAPPQPGPVPISSLPPPPKAGERYQPPTQTPASLTTTMPIPRQMAIPAPAAPYPSHQWDTSTTTMASSSSYGAQTSLGTTGIGGANAEDLSHPAGYQQNTNASELDRYQRSAVERGPDEDGDGIWGAAKKLAQQTGERLAAVEGEVWRKINKE